MLADRPCARLCILLMVQSYKDFQGGLRILARIEVEKYMSARIKWSFTCQLIEWRMEGAFPGGGNPDLVLTPKYCYALKRCVCT